MGVRNDDISLKLAKMVKNGMLPDVSDNEVDILEKEARALFGSDGPLRAKYGTKAGLFIPKFPSILTSDAPTLTYTDHNVAAPFNTLVLPVDSRLSFHGYVAGTRTVNGNPTAINVANGYENSKDPATGVNFGTTSPYDIEFDYVGNGFALNTIGLQSTYKYQIYVDGLPVAAEPLNMDPTKTGNAVGQFVSLTWVAVKSRRIRIRVPSNIALVGIRISTNDSLSAVKKTSLSCYYLGDSWAEGSGALSDLVGVPYILGLLTGWEIYRGGQGGTGYDNPAAGALSRFGSVARLNPIIETKPDFLVVAGTSNDDSNAATVGAKAAAMYRDVEIGSPNTKIIVVGPQNTSQNVSANRELVRVAVINAARLAPNVISVLDPITEAWITGTGTVSAPGTAGNASVLVGGTDGSDGAHLNQTGYEYWARKIYASLPLESL